MFSVSLQDWYHGDLSQVGNSPDDWIELKTPRVLEPSMQTLEVIDLLRNALAHANIQCRSSPGGGIAALVFVANNTKASRARTGFQNEYRYLQTSPCAFHSFLTAWFGESSKWGISQLQIVDKLGASAAA